MLPLGGCAYFHLYRPTITQGNIINDDTVAQLRPGMSADQVLYLMGTPMLTNTFQPDRWDYVYTCKKGWRPRHQRHVTLLFMNGVLQNICVAPPTVVS